MYQAKNAPVKRDWLVAALNRGAVNPQPKRVVAYYHTPSPFAFRVNETRDK